ncbi:snurportin-1 [Toxorhynchites rutilus septentrionalis]|uniref:snurportin-1 n=1 Tax=Toxorhynchites rutilus septentrionalis TaxID=329112 RepID=UPI0024792BFB|nr:snurportin-1 [Toxorhynchites rutilus septentrionalis]
MTDSDDSTSRFSDLYKNKTRSEYQQSERRQRLLEEQKRLRQTEVDSCRSGLLELIEAEGSESECSDSEHKRQRPRIWYSKLYRDKAQLSEWMYEGPADLENWFLVPCPVGIRCLLVIRRGLAVAYDKHGKSITKFATSMGKRQRVTVLDCFMTKERIFYAIDLLVYNEMDLVQCECQFRFLWLRSKLEEDTLQERFCTSKQNRCRLEIIPFYDCKDRNQIEECLSRYPMFPENTRLDGLLFYHKESNYIYGKTPLVTWLFPFMVPDVLGEDLRLTINHHYLQRIPTKYTELGYRAYMEHFDAKLAEKQSRRSKSKITSMDEGCEDTEPSRVAGWEQMETISTIDESYEDENWQRKELDEMRRLEMEG